VRGKNDKSITSELTITSKLISVHLFFVKKLGTLRVEDDEEDDEEEEDDDDDDEDDVEDDDNIVKMYKYWTSSSSEVSGF